MSVATSDVFLRRFVPDADAAEVTETVYLTHLTASTPAQRAALDGLSRSLGLTGESRLKTALAEVRARTLTGESQTSRPPPRLLALRRTWRAELEGRFPGLRQPRSAAEWTKARAAAIAHLASRPNELSPLLAAAREMAAFHETRYADQIKGARWLRLLRLGKSIVLAQRLRASGDQPLIARFDRLRAAESRNPLRDED